ncbi:TetR/AcrR family transcriptional regulator C-terminal domain-containing protein [Paeniglutamicibacter sp. NPDC012692]|uniref:TetR/AcrR family transcriptional regulator C-terminal domain-containing protein n=1 Tax=Paeniglutamicibacter sp. NPDC012692 TaxID=3364388 RepID=UPI0036D1DCE2
MLKETSGPGPPKPQLSRELVLERALDLADHAGLESLTMRSLATALGVKPMSVYYYVANKSEILDGLVDRVFAEADSARSRQDDSWQRAMRDRAVTMRSVLGRHRWALGLIESRTSPGPATLRHHNETLGILRRAGFSVELASRAYALLDSYIYGFVLQESTIPVGDAATVGEVAASMVRQFESGQYPYLLEVATGVVMKPGYDFGSQFEDGLDLVLHGLESWLDS